MSNDPKKKNQGKNRFYLVEKEHSKNKGANSRKVNGESLVEHKRNLGRCIIDFIPKASC